jgi:hypothetical protein
MYKRLNLRHNGPHQLVFKKQHPCQKQLHDSHSIFYGFHDYCVCNRVGEKSQDRSTDSYFKSVLLYEGLNSKSLYYGQTWWISLVLPRIPLFFNRLSRHKRLLLQRPYWLLYYVPARKFRNRREKDVLHNFVHSNKRVVSADIYSNPLHYRYVIWTNVRLSDA